jgi:NADH dehydrogenase
VVFFLSLEYPREDTMILLTGGTGFVGGNLVGELLKDSREVRCMVRDPAKATRLKEVGCELIRGDITDLSTVLKAVDDKIDTVIHLVGILSEPKGKTFRSVHTEGTRNMVEACEKRGVKRYLHISALGTRHGARSEYHRTKWDAEEIIRGSGLEYTIFRPSVIFGKEDRFTNLFASVIKISPVIMVPGNGKNLFQPFFVKDLTRIMAASLDKAETIKKVYEVGGPTRYTFDALIDKLAEVLGKRVHKVHVPMTLMRPGAALAEAILPKPPITRDQLLMLEEDNVTDQRPLEDVFGIKPTGFEQGLRTYLH